MTDTRRSHNSTYHAKAGDALGPDSGIERERTDSETRAAQYVRACNARGGFNPSGGSPYAYGARWRPARPA